MEKGDGFGTQLGVAYVQTSRRATLYVSAPNEGVGGRARAGRVYQFPQSTAGPKAKGSKAFTLATAGVKGSTAGRPHFGIQLSR